MIYRKEIVGYADPNHKDKNKCRWALVEIANRIKLDVKHCFTLPSMYAFCATIFKESWPDSKIVCIERGKNIARLSYANLFCTMLNTNFACYTKKKWAFALDGDDWKRVTDFDYPKYDVAYLDFCANPRDFDMIKSFIINHTMPNSVIGITFSIPPHKNAKEQLEIVAEDIKNLLAPEISLCMEPESMPYETGSNMIFIAFTRAGA